MPLEALLNDIELVTIAGDRNTPIRGVTLDSRKVEPGYLFAALRGGTSDGLDFLGDALGRGAAAVLADRPRPESVTCAWVTAHDAREALALIARSWYMRPDEAIPVIGITGTNGKTTTAYLLESIVQASGGAPGVLGTVSYRLAGRELPAPHTTPEADTLFASLADMVAAHCTHAVIEVSSHALALKRVHGLRFAAAVFTNLTRDHLDFHGTMENYFEAKSLLFRSLEPGALAVLNADSPVAGQLASLTRGRVVTFGSSPAADFRIEDVAPSFEGVRLRIAARGASHEVLSPLPGLPNASNVAAAFATGVSLGLDPQGVLAGIRAFHGAPGRFERVARGQDFHVIVDYAHTDDALTGLLATVRALGPARILTVFGCGGDRDRQKRPLMGAAVARGSDEIILTSDNPRTENPEQIMDDAEAGIRSVPGAQARCRRIGDRREAIAAAIAIAGTGDAVVIAGKGHETYQIVGDRRFPFDDRLVAADCLDLRLGRG